MIPAAARMPITMTQTGHGVRSTNWPLWKRLAGYLKRISNMRVASVPVRDRCRDVRAGGKSYSPPEIDGKFNMRSHFERCPRLVLKDSTRGGGEKELEELRVARRQGCVREAFEAWAHTFSRGHS